VDANRSPHWRNLLKGTLVLVAVLAGILPLAYTVWSTSTEITVPVRVNVLKGVDTSIFGATDEEVKAEIRRIIGQAEKNLQSASTGIALRVDDIELEHEPKKADGTPAENGDGVIDIDPPYQEWNDLGKAASKEMSGGGIKIYITGGYKQGGVTGPASGAAPNHGPTAAPDRIVTLAPAKQTDSDTTKERNDRGNDLAHEICHALTLGFNHPLAPPASPGALPPGHTQTPTRTADGQGHTQTPSNLMYPYNNGVKRGFSLTPTQKKAVQSGAKKVGGVVTAGPGGSATKTQQVFWSDVSGDAGFGVGDLSCGWFVLDWESDRMDVRIDLVGLFEEGGPVMEYILLLDVDGNPRTGDVVEGIGDVEWIEGIEWLCVMYVTDDFRLDDQESGVSGWLYPAGSGTETAIGDLRVERQGFIVEVFGSEEESYAVDTNDSLQFSLPLSKLGEVTDRLSGVLVVTNLMTGETDSAVIPYVESSGSASDAGS
jgi:hypothetical protein